jgi:hypothetical protein
MTDDTGSLQLLNDIVTPPAVPWWPPAPGWYVLGALVLLAAAWLAVRYFLKWRRNRYRREALEELARMRSDLSAARALPALLKRAALSAWPRREVAQLSGAEWRRFLDDSAGMDRFSGETGDILERLAYAGKADHACTAEQLRMVFDAAESWLKQHVREVA